MQILLIDAKLDLTPGENSEWVGEGHCPSEYIHDMFFAHGFITEQRSSDILLAQPSCILARSNSTSAKQALHKPSPPRTIAAEASGVAGR